MNHHFISTILIGACLGLAACSNLSTRTPAQDSGVNRIADAVVAHPAVVAITSLLNSSNNNSCMAPKSQDVKIFCMGALPIVSQPTIASNSCGFFVKINCSNGASAEVNGDDVNEEIVDQNHQVSSYTKVGIVIQNVTLAPAAH